MKISELAIIPKRDENKNAIINITFEIRNISKERVVLQNLI